MSILSLYRKLSTGEKRTLREKYLDFFTCNETTFYRKLSGKIPMRKAEQTFLQMNLKDENKTQAA